MYSVTTSTNADFAHPSIVLQTAATAAATAATAASPASQNRGYRLIATSDIRDGQVVLLTPVIFAISKKGGDKVLGGTTDEICEAAAQLIIDLNLTNSKSESYDQGIDETMTHIYPRTADLGTDNLDRKTVFIRKLKANCFSPGHKYDMCLMKSGNFIDHSCAPNVNADFHPDHDFMAFNSIVPIRAGEEIRTSYSGWPIDNRKIRNELHAARKFTCNCKTCESDDFPSKHLLNVDYDIIRTLKNCWWCGSDDSRPKYSCPDCDVPYCGEECRVANDIHSEICGDIRQKRDEWKMRQGDQDGEDGNSEDSENNEDSKDRSEDVDEVIMRPTIQDLQSPQFGIIEKRNSLCAS